MPRRIAKRAQIKLTAAIRLARKVWLIVILSFSVLVFLGSGIYFQTSPEWTKKNFWSYYNEGTLAWPEGKGKMQSLLGYVASASPDQKLKSLAFYNLGTGLGKEAENKDFPPARRLEMTLGAIGALEEAIRNDPSNQEAKINREILQNRLPKLISEAGEQSGTGNAPSQGPGYSPGSGDKGY